MKMSELILCNGTLAKGTIAKVGGPRNFAVLLVMLESIGVGESFCKLTIEEIASRCGISRDSVMAAVKELTSKPIAVGEQPCCIKECYQQRVDVGRTCITPTMQCLKVRNLTCTD